MKALTRRLGVTARVVPTAWGNLEAGLVAKHYDLILCGWTPNPKTPSAIAASVPYYQWGLVITVRSDNKTIHSFRDLEGAKVGHYQDPAVERTLAAFEGHVRFVSRDEPTALFEDLRSGGLDAVIFDSVYARWRAGHDPAFRVVGEPLNRLGYHVGVRKEDTALFERLDAAIKELTASDEMVQIGERWEGAR
jgi:ABC-type amino acid transport substrate-binding protein